MSSKTQGLLFAGDLLVARKNPVTGVFGGYDRLYADKFELKTPSERLEKISKGRETFGQAWLTYHIGKPAEFSLVLDEISREALAMRLSGEITTISSSVTAIAGAEVTVIPGKWVETGYRNLNPAGLSVKKGETTYVAGTDYEINPRTGMLFVPEGGTISAGTVTLAGATLASAGVRIDGGKLFSTTMKLVLDGINLIDRKNILLTIPQATVTAEDDYDFLSGKLASVPLKGTLEVASGESSAFQLQYLD